MDRLDKRTTHKMFLDVRVLGGFRGWSIILIFTDQFGAKTIGPGKLEGSKENGNPSIFSFRILNSHSIFHSESSYFPSGGKIFLHPTKASFSVAVSTGLRWVH